MSCRESWPCSVKLRAARLIVSSTKPRGKRMRPSGLWVAPTRVTPRCMTGWRWRSRPFRAASRTASWMRSRSASASALYLPPSRPGLIGLISSASGAARMARRASRPPERREPRSTDASCFSGASGFSSAIGMPMFPVGYIRLGAPGWSRAAPHDPASTLGRLCNGGQWHLGPADFGGYAREGALRRPYSREGYAGRVGVQAAAGCLLAEAAS